MSWLKRLFGAASPPAPVAAEAPSALESALATAYPGQTPFLYGAAIAFADGGPDPLDAVSVYWNARGPHWHYVGHGLADVMGAELTFRLAAKPSDLGTEPAKFLAAIAYNAPPWPIKLLNMLARRVHRTNPGSAIR